MNKNPNSALYVSSDTHILMHSIGRKVNIQTMYLHFGPSEHPFLITQDTNIKSYRMPFQVRRAFLTHIHLPY